MIVVTKGFGGKSTIVASLATPIKAFIHFEGGFPLNSCSLSLFEAIFLIAFHNRIYFIISI